MHLKYLVIFFFIISCEVQESTNIYKSPDDDKRIDTKIQLENYSKEKLEIVKSKIMSTFDIKNINLMDNFSFFIKVPDISKYIDCGFMNDEKYVEYIERIFGSSLQATVKIDLIEEDSFFNINKMSIDYLFMSNETGTRWRFKTNKPKELLVGNPVYDENPYRTCISINVLEKKIIEIIRSQDDLL
ncbi:MAG: hypothetical protein CMD46_02285 [Gammaproteobacteria bacterium]|nr:hypothetical protein [Gammaproteobacteria bacterium]|tara:strand:+ start:17913 stop:18470 length:558 start_codon:yes stop_codon:yes gene_type:complete